MSQPDEEELRKQALAAQAEYYRLKGLEVAQRIEGNERRRAMVNDAAGTAKAAVVGGGRVLWLVVRFAFALAAVAAFIALTRECPR